MAKSSLGLRWATHFQHQWHTLAQHTLRAGSRIAAKALVPMAPARRPASNQGSWIAGIAIGPAGTRRYRLYQPAGVRAVDRLPLMVMLHGCGQDAKGFAQCTGMNRLAAREGFLVLYPEQERLANTQGCWNWFETASGRAYGEAELIMAAIDQVGTLYPVDRAQVAIAGLSAGASMAALLVTRHPARFKAVAMHSGIPPGTAQSGISALRAMVGRRPTPPLAATTASMVASWPPLLVIHGRGDSVVAIENGQAAARVWAEAAGARAGKSRTVQRGKRYSATITDFQRLGQPVATLVEVDALGHAWSGGAPALAYSDARGPDASRMVWSFAAKQFRR